MMKTVDEADERNWLIHCKCQGILLLKGLTCRPCMSNCVELVRTVTCNVPRYIAAFWAMGLNTSC